MLGNPSFERIIKFEFLLLLILVKVLHIKCKKKIFSILNLIFRLIQIFQHTAAKAKKFVNIIMLIGVTKGNNVK